MSRFAYVGSYGPPDGAGTGITVFRIDPKEPGKFLESIETIATPSPSWLCLNRSRTNLYAVNELNDYKGHEGTVTAFRVDRETGLLTQLNVRSARGYQPCHVTLDPSERRLLIANYGTGSVLVCGVSAEDGSLEEDVEFDQLVEHHGSGPNESRQESSHAHMIYFLKDDLVLVPDLGQDKVLFYQFLDGRLIPSKRVCQVPAGAGPRHVTASADGRFLYVINELNSTISLFTSLEETPEDPTRSADVEVHDQDHGRRRSTSCQLRLLQTISTLPTVDAGDIPDKVLRGAVSSGCAAIVLHPNGGKFLYGSNRGHDSIVVYAVDAGNTGRLTLVGHQKTLGRTPRHFDIDPSGTVLSVANQGSDNIVTFRIDLDTGLLTPTGDVVKIPSPVSIVFV